MVKEFISQLPPDKLSPFAKHPYRVREDAAMDELVESIRVHGILSPMLARPKGEGYELVSGHRRRLAAQKLGLPTVPVLVREMSDDEAVILMVDSNLQRENLLPSEKAFAYKMKLEAMNRQGRRTDLTSTTAQSERANPHQNRVAAEVFPAQLLCAADGAGDHQAAGGPLPRKEQGRAMIFVYWHYTNFFRTIAAERSEDYGAEFTAIAAGHF